MAQQIKYYSKKVDALTQIKNDTFLFSEDIGKKGAKRFFIQKRATLWNIMQKKNNNHFYEHVENDTSVKLHFDIDIKIDGLADKNKKYLQICIMQCIKRYNAILKNDFGIDTPKIIILDATIDTKLSSHIIYTNVHFNSLVELKQFFCLLQPNFRDDCNLDPAIYRVGCFRMFGNSKINKHNKLILSKSINYNVINDKQTFLDSLITNVLTDSHLIPIAPLVAQKKISFKPNKITVNNAEITINNVNICEHFDDVIKCIDLLSVKRSDHYYDWIKIGLCLFNIENSQRSFDLFNKFSMKSSKYINEQDCSNKWKSFINKNDCKKTTIGTLKYMAKKDNPAEYQLSFTKPVTIIELFPTIKFSQQYLIDNNKSITVQSGLINNITDWQQFDENNTNNIVCVNILKWLYSDSKTIVIKSPYNTGKTALLTSIFDSFLPQFKRVLIITYRVSLANEFDTIFEKYGFENYSYGFFDEPYLICQIESLYKISLEEGMAALEYDLVIIDEIESVLNHFTSPTIKVPEATFNHLCTILKSSKKIIALDGDFGARSYDFLTHFSKPIILENSIKKNIKHFNFINDITTFDKNIENDLKLGHNILLVCLSATVAKKYYATFAKYNPALYCSDIDDNIKLQLGNVEKYWKLKQLVIITPCVESGVSFNLPHFYKQYAIVSDRSTSPRGLSQMLARVRQFTSSDVDIFTNNLPIYTSESFYNYNDVEEYVTLIKNNKNNNSLSNPLFHKITIHNYIEKANKTRNLFLAYFIYLCKLNGHTCITNLTPKDKLVKTTKNNDAHIDKKEIIKKTTLVDDSLANDIHCKIVNNHATQYEKYCYEKYSYSLHWYKAVLNDDFFDKWYGKTYILYNLRKLLGNNELPVHDDIINPENSIINFCDIESNLKVDKIKSLIIGFGFDLSKIKTTIQDTCMKINIANLIKNNDIFDIKNALLFSDDKHSIANMLEDYNTNHKDSTFIRYINANLLCHYGLIINYKSKTIRIKTNSNNSNKDCTYSQKKFYFLTFINKINIYVS